MYTYTYTQKREDGGKEGGRKEGKKYINSGANWTLVLSISFYFCYCYRDSPGCLGTQSVHQASLEFRDMHVSAS